MTIIATMVGSKEPHKFGYVLPEIMPALLLFSPLPCFSNRRAVSVSGRRLGQEHVNQRERKQFMGT